MHGSNVNASHRYDGAPEPDCQSCHADQVDYDAGIKAHRAHEPDVLACQVCHSTSYVNCVNCHVEQTDEGQAFFRVEDNFLGFYIGRNPAPTEERPYQYVPVRHVPIDPESFSFYGDDLLSNFDSRPTWVYTTPHNIQRETAQGSKCGACHENNAVFLTPDKVAESERDANRDVIVEKAPSMFESDS
jgi:thiosulfate/3-mercaptopyruvate sulfurtransferase